MNNTFNYSFYYDLAGISVIPGCSPKLDGHNKNVCGKSLGKHPLVKWEEFQKRRPTKEELTEWNEQFPEANIIAICGAVSENLIAIDIEGHKHDEWEKWVKETKITLPMETVQYQTGGGGIHIWYRTRMPVRKKKFRWGEIQGEGSYVVVPPSVHRSGELYKPIPEKIEIAQAPHSLEEMLLEPNAKVFIDQLKNNPISGRLEQLENLSEGERVDTLVRYGARLISKGLEPDEVNSILWSYNLRANPPLSQKEFDQSVLKAAHRFYLREIEETQKIVVSAKAENQETPQGVDWEDPWEFPMDVIRKKNDLIGEWTWEMESIREAPPQFLYFSIIQQVLTACSEQTVLQNSRGQKVIFMPKMFLMLVGDSGSKKSSSWEDAEEFMRKVNLESGGFPRSYTLSFSAGGSGEGIQKALGIKKSAHIYSDEFRGLLAKMRQEGNNILPFMTLLFDKGEIQSLTKKDISDSGEATVERVYASFSTNAILEDIKSGLTRNMELSGFLNRLWIVLGKPKRAHVDRVPMEERKFEVFRQKFKARLNEVGTRIPVLDPLQPRPTGKNIFRRDNEAQARFEKWYVEEFWPLRSPEKLRLDHYFKTFELVLAISRCQNTITLDIIEDVIKMIRYELAVRKFVWSYIVAGSVDDWATRIISAVENQPGIGYRDLHRKVHAHRHLEAFARAYKLVCDMGEILETKDPVTGKKQLWLPAD